MSYRNTYLSASVLGLLAAAPAVGQTMTADQANASGLAAPDVAPAAAAASTASPASGPQSANSFFPGEIIVTAQKRSERVNDVPITIAAISGQTLQQRGVTDTADLARIVVGFNYTKSSYGTPIYLLRGVGFYDSSLAVSPAVSIYVDEVPLPFSRMGRGAVFDLERVEVLKGPQGTLFGQNSTGGAINYIAAKPTKDLHAGFDLGYSRFGRFEGQGFVSGPLSDTLKVRVAARRESGGAWQISNTRPGDKLGRSDLSIGRLLLDWDPTSKLSFNLNINGWVDKSDTQASQLVGFLGAVSRYPLVAAEPLSPQTARAANWDPNEPFRRDDKYGQASLRTNYQLGDDFKLTSITNYAHLKVNDRVDADGTAAQDFTAIFRGTLSTFSQELRVEGNTPEAAIRWIIGGNYEHDRSQEALTDLNRDFAIRAFFQSAVVKTNQKIDTYAGFANADLKVASNVTVRGGVRYTDQHRRFDGCLFDTGVGDLAGFTSRVNRLNPAIPPGGCVTLGANNLPGIFTSELNQSNWSWRGSVDWKVDPNKLLYASVSRGYKNGSFPTLGATRSFSFSPAVQEALLSYEAGFKLGLFDRTVQLNGAAYYYDYSDKQVRGKIVDPVLGPANALVNIPKSRVLGAELQLDWNPVRELRLSGALAYTDSKIGHFTNYNALGTLQAFDGEPFPYTPKWQLTGDAEYRHSIGPVEVFLGASIKHQSRTNAGLGQLALFTIKPYTTIDLRAGGNLTNGIGFTIFVKNVTNTYYWNNTFLTSDTISRYAELPRTYGATLSYRY